MENTRLEVRVERPVDGDTVRVKIGDRSEAVRIQALDTEESRAGGDKPITPWGKKAAEHAATLFAPGKKITLDFDTPQDGEVRIDLSRFRDNFGRLLALAFVDGQDFEEHMIEAGYSRTSSSTAMCALSVTTAATSRPSGWRRAGGAGYGTRWRSMARSSATTQRSAPGGRCAPH
jgi:endonuclease YncB( thermonuclease family)